MSPITPSSPASRRPMRRSGAAGCSVPVSAPTLSILSDLARDVSLRRTPGGVDLDIVEGIDALTQDLPSASPRCAAATRSTFGSGSSDSRR